MGKQRGKRLSSKLTYVNQELERSDRGRSAFLRRRKKMETRLWQHVFAEAEAPCWEGEE